LLTDRARDILPLAKFSCPNTCGFGGNCINKIVLLDIAREREKIWGELGHSAPNRTTRAEAVERHLRESYDPTGGGFKFKIFSSIVGESISICEIASAVILNLFKGNLIEPSHIRVSSQWKKFRDIILGKYIQAERQRGRRALKYTHALGFIENYKEKSCDKLPTAAPKAHPRGVAVVPHKRLSGFYRSYQLQHEDDPLSVSQTASLKVFRKAFGTSAEQPLTIRFKTCDNNFSTCDACANIEIIKDKYKTGDKRFRNIRDFSKFVDGYMELHQEQQEEERTFAELNKREAAQKLDENGQPTSWYANVDPTTETTGATPCYRTRAGRTSKSDAGKQYFFP
jgi:hypothetical protein